MFSSLQNVIHSKKRRNDIIITECTTCKKPIQPTSNNQKYCKECSHKRRQATKNAYKKRNKAPSTINCQYCGKPLKKEFPNQKYHKGKCTKYARQDQKATQMRTQRLKNLPHKFLLGSKNTGLGCRRNTDFNVEKKLVMKECYRLGIHKKQISDNLKIKNNGIKLKIT